MGTGLKTGFMLTNQNSPADLDGTHLDMGDIPGGLEHLQFTHMLKGDGSEYMIPLEEAKRLNAKYGDAFKPKFPFKVWGNVYFMTCEKVLSTVITGV